MFRLFNLSTKCIVLCWKYDFEELHNVERMKLLLPYLTNLLLFFWFFLNLILGVSQPEAESTCSKGAQNLRFQVLVHILCKGKSLFLTSLLLTS